MKIRKFNESIDTLTEDMFKDILVNTLELSKDSVVFSSEKTLVAVIYHDFFNTGTPTEFKQYLKMLNELDEAIEQIKGISPNIKYIFNILSGTIRLTIFLE